MSGNQIDLSTNSGVKSRGRRWTCFSALTLRSEKGLRHSSVLLRNVPTLSQSTHFDINIDIDIDIVQYLGSAFRSDRPAFVIFRYWHFGPNPPPRKRHSQATLQRGAL